MLSLKYLQNSLFLLPLKQLVKETDRQKIFFKKETDNYLDRYHITKLNRDQIKILNGPKTPKKLETVIKNLPTKNKQRNNNKTGPDSFSTEFYQNFKKELIPTLLWCGKSVYVLSLLVNE